MKNEPKINEKDRTTHTFFLILFNVEIHIMDSGKQKFNITRIFQLCVLMPLLFNYIWRSIFHSHHHQSNINVLLLKLKQSYFPDF